MPWPPAMSSRRVALVIYGLALLVYIMLSGLLVAAGLDLRTTIVVAQFAGLLGLSLGLARLMKIPIREAFALRPAAPVHWYMALAAAIPLQAAGGAIQFAVVNRLAEDSPWRRMMEETVQQFVAAETGFDVLMLVLAAVIAIFLAAVGIYGVIAYVVSQRTAEIGVRMAIGAPAREVSNMVVRQGLVVVGAGVVLGLIAAVTMTRLMTTLLFEVDPLDPLTFAAVPLLLLGAGLVACLLPARRAASVDPAVALRSE